MKTNFKWIAFLMIASVFAQIHTAFGQATQATNALTGSAPDDPTEFLGSDNAFDVIIKADDTERLRLQQATGRVAIGTVDPRNLLHLNSDTEDERVYLQFNNTGEPISPLPGASLSPALRVA